MTATITRSRTTTDWPRTDPRLLPAAPFENEEKGGFYTIKPPSRIPPDGSPERNAQLQQLAPIFVAGILQETRPECGGGEGTGTSEFQSADPLDLAGDGNVEENYCQQEARLEVTATGGPSFSLKKFVKGELDAERKSGARRRRNEPRRHRRLHLLWANNGSAPLKNAGDLRHPSLRRRHRRRPRPVGQPAGLRIRDRIRQGDAAAARRGERRILRSSTTPAAIRFT